MNNNLIEVMKENNGMITTKQAKELGFSKIHLKKMLEEGKIEKVKNGVYLDRNKFGDEYYIFQVRYNNAIFSYNTALYILGETERTPINLDVTVYRGYNAHRFPQNITVHYVKREFLDLGVIERKSPQGSIVKLYNLERTLCDIIRNKNNSLDTEQVNKVTKRLLLGKKVDINLLFEYAEKLKCLEKLKLIMELII